MKAEEKNQNCRHRHKAAASPSVCSRVCKSLKRIEQSKYDKTTAAAAALGKKTNLERHSLSQEDVMQRGRDMGKKADGRVNWA